ncbi:hypothetical protein C1646_775817 [Rhizophagus diaphanus]|nr:hypothetical protein C1646_775817 [Rhizophagus diaphanus] [Rhizophagus sp. MUCL 43196]
MQSNDSLRKLNAKLLTEIAELRKKFSEIKIENDELKDKNTEIPELRSSLRLGLTERAELKARIAELLKQGLEENQRRDAENTKLKARIEELESENEFRDRITKVEQRQMLNNPKGNNSSNNNSSNFNLVADQVPMVTHHEKPLVDTSLPEKLIPEGLPEVTVSTVNIPECYQTSLEDMETDAFLDEVHKPSLSSSSSL